MQHRDFIIKNIENMSGSHSPYEVFTDWVKMSAISIQNACVMIHDKVWKDREQQYMLTQKKYTNDEMMTFSSMLAAVTFTFDEKFDDALAEPYKPGYPKERVWRTPAEMGALL